MKYFSIGVMALALAAPSVSFAAPPSDGSDVVSAKVSYGDLNLSNRNDAARLLHRIDNAATDACGGWISNNPIDIAESRDSVQCHQAAVKGAVAQVNVPTVSALYDRKIALAANGQ
jgi:UrcA family protein